MVVEAPQSGCGVRGRDDHVLMAELCFRFGAPNAYARVDEGQVLTLGLSNALLAGPGEERWPLPGRGEIERHDDFLIWRGERGMCGVAAVPVGDRNIEGVTEQLYTTILTLTDGLVLHRFWNFIPQINQPVGELDRYMCFCTGRARAFSNPTNPFTGEELPPASAVGTHGDHLCVVFVAGPESLTPVENPLQVPAYEYPPKYGPRSPSFARAGVIDATRTLLISGTASIRGSESLHPGDFESQARTALENIQAVSEAAGCPEWLAGGGTHRSTVRVYVKDAGARLQHAAWFERHLPVGIEQINFIQADICRAELLLELEACAVPHEQGE